ncbi:hypothetical protein [Neorhizobium galegae]|uniref:hypothetical protein n=1 Tax=Neorhizobium galegae TaxID=399 RepID=UPI0006211F8E|nr:hypothetical protein [Neorhizobium galegae]CDZ55029.1 Hypothetical protein NGAL_HAMBI2427_59500 [Neorhizobium galegae bv. orientalis]
MKRGFIAGFAAATAEIVRTHGEPAIAADVLRAGDFTLDDFRKAKIDDYDMVIIERLFAEEYVLKSAR